MLLQRRRVSRCAPKQGHCSEDTSNLLIKQLLCVAVRGAETSLEGEARTESWGGERGVLCGFFFILFFVFCFLCHEQRAKHTLC